ncbi:MAG TPA: hypothetical protein VL793_11510, partial [Patescibacteria group bacterium]|nr:hypothetical protein [Patescibacteria group bacterium]
MSERADHIVTIVVLSLAFASVAFLSIRRAEDPSRMLFKWIFTGVIVIYIGWKVFPAADAGGMAAFAALANCMLAGLALFITWRIEIGSLVAKPFASLYDGGNVEPEPRPFYSIARARQKQAKYEEAIIEIRKQLERFPTDFEGQMFLAEIQAQDLKDLTEAEVTIQTLCAQSGHAPKNIAFALYSLADWQLKYCHDAEAARRAFEQIIQLLPESE